MPPIDVPMMRVGMFLLAHLLQQSQCLLRLQRQVGSHHFCLGQDGADAGDCARTAQMRQSREHIIFFPLEKIGKLCDKRIGLFHIYMLLRIKNTTNHPKYKTNYRFFLFVLEIMYNFAPERKH